jgi:hypothetical protein
MLMAAGSSLHYREDPDGDNYLRRLLSDATPTIRGILKNTKK